MFYKYFNNGNIAKIKMIIAQNRLEETLACYYNYIGKYSVESLAKIWCADILIKLGIFDEVENLFFSHRLLINFSIRW